MTQGSSQPSGRARLARPHRAVVIVDENSNPFELGCAPEDADTLIVPNRPDVEAPRRPDVLDAVRRAHARGARLVGFCSGAFTLAEAGVLEGRRATAHWMWGDRFRERFPSVRFEQDVLYVDDGEILTAAGSAAALDLGLHIVHRDFGAEIANAVSRRLVFAAHRDGGQKQLIERPVPEIRDRSLGPVLEWAQQHLNEPLTVADLAARAAISPASLHRRFKEQLGTTPRSRWVVFRRSARSLSGRFRPSATLTSAPSGSRRPVMDPKTDACMCCSRSDGEITRAVSPRLAVPARYRSRSLSPRLW